MVEVMPITVMAITCGLKDICDSRFRGEQMENPSLQTAINKLAIFGERAGFSVEQMIQILNSGVSVETLLQLIASNLEMKKPAAPSSRWIM
jgi:hypothetical protein